MTAGERGPLNDAIFDDVLALSPPSALWPRPAAIGQPSRSNRGATGRQGGAAVSQGRRGRCGGANVFSWLFTTADMSVIWV